MYCLLINLSELVLVMLILAILLVLIVKIWMMLLLIFTMHFKSCILVQMDVSINLVLQVRGHYLYLDKVMQESMLLLLDRKSKDSRMKIKVKLQV